MCNNVSEALNRASVWCIFPQRNIAARFGKLEKSGSHHGADRMTSHVLSPGVAATVAAVTPDGHPLARVHPRAREIIEEF
jgi:hypothetical protein